MRIVIMTKEELIDIIIPLRRIYQPKLDRFFGYEAEDILASVVASCLFKADTFKSVKHVQAFFAKSISGKIKSEFRRKERGIKLINDLPSRVCKPSIYDLRQALNIALATLTNTMQSAIWKVYVLEERLGKVAKALDLTPPKLKLGLAKSLALLREHPALKPWKPK